MSKMKVVTPDNMGKTIEFGELEVGKFNVKLQSEDLQINEGGEIGLSETIKDKLQELIKNSSKKDAFLSNVTYDSSLKELVLTVTNGEGTEHPTDKEIRVSVADLIPVTVEGILTGTGTDEDPIKIDTDLLVELTDASGQTQLGYILPTA